MERRPSEMEQQRAGDKSSSMIDHSSPTKVDTLDQTSDSSGPEKSPPESTQSQNAGDPWKRAVKRLYRTVLSVSETNSAYANPEEALNALLEVVENNENVTEQDLLKKLRDRKDGAINADHSERISNQPTESKGKVSLDGDLSDACIHTDESLSEEEYGDAEETKKGKRHQFFERLSKVGKRLADGSRGGLSELDEVLFQENVAGKFHTAIEYVVLKLQEQWDYILNLAMPRQQLQTLFFVSVLQVISIQRVFSFVPLLICYASFLIMIYSTLAMFGSRTWLKRAECWRRLLTIFQPSTEKNGGKKIEDGGFYSWKSTEPYITYFISLALFVFSLALINDDDGACGTVLPNSWSMCAISVFFAILCFLALADKYDLLAIWVMLLDILTSMPWILLKFGVHTNNIPMVGVLLTNREIYRLGLIRIQVGFPSLAIFATIVVYACMVLAYRRRDMYTVVIPHIVCIAWCHTGLELFLINDIRSIFSSVGWYDVFLTFGVIWLITFPTMAALSLVVAVLVAQLRHIFDAASLTKTAITATILLLPFLYRKLRQLAEKRSWTTAKAAMGAGEWKATALALMIYGFLVFASAAVLYESRFATNDIAGGKLAKELTWTQYEKYCSYADENLGNRLRQQVACSQIRNAVVNWKGTVQAVRISKIENVFETVLSYLPDELATRLKCFYGDKINETAADGSVLDALQIGACTLTKHNVYTFEIDVAGPWGLHKLSSAKGTVVLTASAAFQDLVNELEQGDVVDFTAAFLPDSMLKYPPKLKLIQMQCLACQQLSVEKHAASFAAPYGGNIWSKLFNACSFLFNFICAPIFVIG